MSIALESVSKRYGDVSVVREVSLRVATGELFVLLGPSGSGKSTLLRMIAGLTPTDGGRILLQGRDVTSISPKDRGVGFVFQHYALFRHMSVADNVEFPLRIRHRPRRERQRRCSELLELVGLTGFGRRRPHQLSGGQQQRVALARALAHEPPVLLLDEPFGALDAKIRVELRHTIRRIQRELGLTTIFVTHDQEEAFALADRLAVLELGRLVEIGSPTELYRHPRNEFVATFLGEANVLVGETTARSVRLGPVELPLPLISGSPPGGRVRVLFRPEDIEVARESPMSPMLGRGEVEEATFAGSLERVRVRLPTVRGVRSLAPAVPFGARWFRIDAVRPQHETRSFPVAPGDVVAVGVRRLHVLAPVRLRLVVPRTDGDGSVRAETYARALAERMGLAAAAVEIHRPLAVVAPASTDADEPEPERYDIAVVPWDDGATALDPGGVCSDADHLLLTRGPLAPPRRILLAVAVGEPAKSDVHMTERIAWRLGASVTLLTVLDPLKAEGDEELPEHVRHFLTAASEALGSRGVAVTTKVRRGHPAREIVHELRDGSHDLLVSGAWLQEDGRFRPRGILAHVLEEARESPVLVVRLRRERAVPEPV